jgi:hypothetical protein
LLKTFALQKKFGLLIQFYPLKDVLSTASLPLSFEKFLFFDILPFFQQKTTRQTVGLFCPFSLCSSGCWEFLSADRQGTLSNQHPLF